ncbi:MAG: glycosyltransferase family 4 protein, partial [Leptospiraceae bacterium]|nr:glycosyltransferase family 4 protein [Leptospiraceae bacterium]
MNNQKVYNIALDARPLSTRISGVGRLIGETLFHFPEKEKYIFHLFTHLPIHETHKKILDLPNIKVHQGEGFFAKKGGLYFLVTMPLEIRKGNYDLFWGSQQVAPFFLPSKLPIVLTYCDLVVYLFPGTMRKIAALQQKIFQSYSVKKSKFILSISENTRTDQINHFQYPKEKTGVAYPGIDIKEIEELLKTPPGKDIKNLPDKFLLSVSTIEPRKNYSFLFKVFRKYRELEGKNSIKWVIIGKKGWETEEFYSELNKDIEKYNDIIILDNITDSDLHHAYKKSSLFLFGSVYEGFGIPLLEALYHKK